MVLIYAIGFAFLAIKFWHWLSDRNDRAEQVAELEAISLHTRPILIRSQFIGDNDVEHRAALVKQMVGLAKNGFISPDDVHLAIYSTRTRDARAFLEFQDWADMVDEVHRKRVANWEAGKTKAAQEAAFTDAGKRYFTGQKDPREKSYTIEFDDL